MSFETCTRDIPARRSSRGEGVEGGDLGPGELQPAGKVARAGGGELGGGLADLAVHSAAGASWATRCCAG
ncbi:hypothetical protein [Nannocystis pusilla]|uniref:Uncharacterized protein n=1 Tax=Nannocystis pusilla TaxID=889268 RepID=A0ABS7TPE6_9BACT|nr:hypothetical protein [Nannocystis pusilla]MBZ5710065.1 hypothetical protein [Nannocystis pusilla]